MKVFTCKFVQDEVTHQRLRGRFKKGSPARPRMVERIPQGTSLVSRAERMLNT